MYDFSHERLEINNAINRLHLLRNELMPDFVKADEEAGDFYSEVIDPMEANESLYSDEAFDEVYDRYDVLLNTRDAIGEKLEQVTDAIQHLKKAFGYLCDI